MTSLDAAVELAPYDSSWPRLFAEEAERLQAVLTPWLAGPIEHVGSTAIPGLAAKPTIDIMAGVETLDASRPAIAAVTEVGYCYAPYQAEIEHWFCKPSPAMRTHHLHLIPIDSPQWIQPLAFRNYVRAHRDVAHEYETLKRKLAQAHRVDREAYTQGKRRFIERITAIAIQTGYGRRHL